MAPMAVPLMGFQLVPVTAVAMVKVLPNANDCASETISTRPSSESLDDLSFSRSTSESAESELSDDGCITGCVWDLSQRTKGCRRVQQALEDPGVSNAARSALALELKGKVRQCARSACGNYVLQKFIQVLRPQACQFIIDEIMEEPEEVSNLAKHQYACRILRRLLENCQAQMEGIIRLLLQDALPLVRHNYGTFVMQEVFDFGSESQRSALGETLLQSIGALSSDENGTQVVQKALLHAPQKVTLAQRMVPQFAQIARGRHSHQTVLAALQVLPQKDQDKAVALLSQKVQKLWASRYGRLVVKSIPSLHQQCVGMTRREAAAA